MTATTMPQPVLKADRIYIAFDRFVCGSTRCAGMTAVYTGQTIDGAEVLPAVPEDVTDWLGLGMGPLTCECGKLTAIALAGPDGLAMTKAGQ